MFTSHKIIINNNKNANVFSPPRRFPLPIAGAVGAYIDGEVLVCGGETDEFYEFRCWGYDEEEDRWVGEKMVFLH